MPGQADKAAGRATVKDSCARNLHRLINVVKFLRLILEQLASSGTVTVREATSKAYTEVRARCGCGGPGRGGKAQARRAGKEATGKAYTEVMGRC